MECTPSPILWVNLIKDGMGGPRFTKQNAYRVLVWKLEGIMQGKPKNRTVDATKRETRWDQKVRGILLLSAIQRKGRDLQYGKRRVEPY